jgi:hypothetical protein
MTKIIATVLGLVLSVASIASATRTWIPDQIVTAPIPFNGGVSPSLVLLNGVQPIVANGIRSARRTPFGWETYSALASNGFIASDGAQNIVSNENLVTYSPDGKFYSYSNSTQKVYQGGSWTTVGAPLTAASGMDLSAVGANADGRIYAAWENKLAMSTIGNQGWYPAMDFSIDFDLECITDLAVSPYGEVAISGYASSFKKTVIWYDYKSSSWNVRNVTSVGTQNEAQIGIGWDPSGNLGVAYTDSNDAVLKFDYLNMETSAWSSEIVLVETFNANDGTDLGYDRFGNPVIVAGNWLVYDPPITPEPMTMLLFAIGGLACLRKRRCQ